MYLDYFTKNFFREHGYCVIPGVIPPIMLRKTLTLINASLGKGMDTKDMDKFNNRSFCPELMLNPQLIDLFTKTPAYSIAETFLGNGKVKPAHEAQIVLRFPLILDKPVLPVPHIDGFYSPLNDVEKGAIYSFTALAGIYLQDVDTEWAGNFTVWPKSHAMLETYFRQHEPHPTLPNGIPAIELGSPLQIQAKAGDLIFCHYQLAHAAAVNLSPYIRYAVFFRLEHIQHSQQKIAAMQNIWLEWEGLNTLV